MFRPLALVVLAAASVASQASAFPFVWTSPTAGNWSAGANWRGGAPPPAGGAADFDLVFRPRGGGGTFHSTNDLGAFDLRSLGFQSGRGYGLGGIMASASTVNSPTVLRFTATEGAAIYQLSGGDVQVNAPLDFGTAVELGGDGTGVIQLAGRLTGAGSLTVDRGTGVSILGNAFADPGSTFSGGVDLLSGTLLIDSAGALGTGALRANGATSFGVSPFAGVRDFIVANPIQVIGSLRITGLGSLTLTGGISGNGRLVIEPDRFGSSVPVVRVPVASAFTGDLVVQSAASAPFSLNGVTGGFASAASVTVTRGAVLEVDDRGGAANRLPDAGPVNLGGGATLTYRSGANRTSVETIGPLRTSGIGTVLLNPDNAEAQSSAVMTSAAWQPAAGSVTVFRGRGLGGSVPGTPGADNFLFANAAAVQATQIGGGGGAGSSTISILPQAVIGNTNNASDLNQLYFATYDGVRGIRPLSGAEASTAITDGAQALTNVRLLSSITLNQPTRVNALALDLSPSGSLTGSISGSGTLTVASGLVIMSPRNSQLSVAEIAFGAQRGTIMTSLLPAGGPASSAATISSRLTGTNGLTIAGAGTINLTGANQIDGGLLIAAPVIASSPAALGGSGPIELNGGSLSVGGALNRDVIVSAGGGTLTGGITHTGALHGGGELTVQGVVLSGSGSTFSGVVRFENLVIDSAGALGPNATLRATVGAASPSLRVQAPVSLAGGLELFSNTISGTLPITVDASLTLGGVRMTRFTPALLGGITKQGAGTMTVNGDLDVRGPIQVSAGTLIVNGQVAAPGSAAASPLVVNANAVFGGSARVFRDVSLGGMLRPGAMGTVDLLRIDGTLSAAAGSAFEWDHRGSGSDVVDVAGSLAFSGGTVTFRLRALDAALPSGFDLLVRTGEGITGTLPTFALDFTDAPAWASLGLYVQPVGTDLYLVPEPAPMALLAAGLLGLGLFRRSRRSAGSAPSEEA